MILNVSFIAGVCWYDRGRPTVKIFVSEWNIWGGLSRDLFCAPRYVIDSDASPSSFICCGLGCRSCETQPVRYVQCRSDAVWPFHQYWCGWSIAAGRNQKQHCTAPASSSSSSSCTSQPATTCIGSGMSQAMQCSERHSIQS